MLTEQELQRAFDLTDVEKLIWQLTRKAPRPVIDAFEAIRERLDSASRIAAVPPLEISASTAGWTLRDARRRSFAALLSGSANPYSWTTTTGLSGTSNAYEVNGLTSLNGRHVRLYPDGHGGYRFQLNKHGAGSPPPCHSQLCFRLVNPCTGTLTGWDLTLKDPGGTVIATELSNNVGICADIKGMATGSYVCTATRTVDLSAYGGPSSYTMTYTNSVSVTDVCNVPSGNVIEVVENWWAFGLQCSCNTSSDNCLVPTSVTLSTSVGTWTGDASTTQRICFTGFDGLSGPDPVTWTATVTGGTWTGGCSGSVPRCGLFGSENGPGANFAVVQLGGGDCAQPEANYRCGPCSAPIPETLFYSDGAGTATCTYDNDPFSPFFTTWHGAGSEPSLVAYKLNSYTNNCEPFDTANFDIIIWPQCDSDGVYFLVQKTMYTCFPGSAPPCTTGISARNGSIGHGRTTSTACDPSAISSSGTLTPDSCNLDECSGSFTITS